MTTVIDVRNVHQALPEGAWQMTLHGELDTSRNGAVKVLPGPCVTTYREPRERVEFHDERDSNPFFHLMESLWMLAGCCDVGFVKRYSSNIAQFSDDGLIFNGAYGYRWRHWFDVDQLHEISTNLKDNPSCRRQVLAMWDGHEDLSHKYSKDIPCNLSAVFQLDAEGLLDMTVFNRSNDLIWGAYGANAVHFSVLHEYMAEWIGRPIGRYHQVSANTHVYEHHFGMLNLLANKVAMPPSRRTDPYSGGHVTYQPLILQGETIEDFDRDVSLMMANETYLTKTNFFQTVVLPMVMAYNEFKDRMNPERHEDALSYLVAMPSSNDWRVACTRWLQRRLEKHAK